MEYYSTIKNEIMPFAATWMDLEITILSEVNLRKTNMLPLTRGRQRVVHINLFTKQTRSGMETCGYQKGRVGLTDATTVDRV